MRRRWTGEKPPPQRRNRYRHQMSRQNPAQSTATTASQQPAQTVQSQKTRATRMAAPPAPYAAWDKDGVKIIPYGIIIANVNYNSSAVDPGSIVGFALPDTQTNTPQ